MNNDDATWQAIAKQHLEQKKNAQAVAASASQVRIEARPNGTFGFWQNGTLVGEFRTRELAQEAYNKLFELP